MSARIEKLRDAVEARHRCKAQHVESGTVIDRLGHDLVWDGVVETFDISGHPTAGRCYAWIYEENGETRFTTVLGLPPAYSPLSAVRNAIRAQAESRPPG